ncbi:MAG: MerR family transcriptional regulator [Thiobacillus sp.]|nr:MerR family transcriptional regulator [Thiobacillus sp.]
MKIGEVARRVGVSISALRLYEQRGLIKAGRSEGGTRHYGEEDMERFRAIVSLTRVGVSIDPLARLARIRVESASGDVASQRVEAVLAEVEADIEVRLKLLQSARTDIRRAKQQLTGCHGCPKRPTRRNCTGCPVAAKLLACQVMRIVWDQGPKDV